MFVITYCEFSCCLKGKSSYHYLDSQILASVNSNLEMCSCCFNLRKDSKAMPYVILVKNLGKIVPLSIAHDHGSK